MAHTYASVNYVIINPDYGLPLARCHAIIWINTIHTGVFIIGSKRTNFRDIWFKIQNTKNECKNFFCTMAVIFLGPNVLTYCQVTWDLGNQSEICHLIMKNRKNVIHVVIETHKMHFFVVIRQCACWWFGTKSHQCLCRHDFDKYQLYMIPTLQDFIT